MKTNRNLVSATALVALLLVACHGTQDGRTADLSPQPSLGGDELDFLSPEACTGLVNEYGLAFREAQKCDPLQDDNPCTLRVDSSLACPCRVHVNRGNREAHEKMVAAKSAWSAGGCFKLDQVCLQFICAEHKKAECTAVPSVDPSEPARGICAGVSK